MRPGLATSTDVPLVAAPVPVAAQSSAFNPVRGADPVRTRAPAVVVVAPEDVCPVRAPVAIPRPMVVPDLAVLPPVLPTDGMAASMVALEEAVVDGQCCSDATV